MALQTQWLYEDAVQLEEIGETLNDLALPIFSQKSGSAKK